MKIYLINISLILNIIFLIYLNLLFKKILYFLSSPYIFKFVNILKNINFNFFLSLFFILFETLIIILNYLYPENFNDIGSKYFYDLNLKKIY
jgi:hypothetical protein